MSEAEKNLAIAIKRYLQEKGEDMNRNGVVDTPNRFVKQLNENLSGYSLDPKSMVKVFDCDDCEELICVKDIDFSSQCEHHILPFVGKINIAYLPDGKIMGLSKFARIAEAYAKRLQVQERLAKQIADVIEEALMPKLLIVQVVARHTCMITRGVCKSNSLTETTIVRGDSNKYSHYVNYFQNGAKLS